VSVKSAIIHSLDLPQNHTDLLLVLSTTDSSATELLKKTSVSNGRIYKILSELESLGLITKKTPSTRGQAIYSLEPFASHIQAYLQHNFRTHSQKISAIINSLDSLDSSDSIEVVHGSKADFDHHIENFLYQASWIKILHKHTSLPWFLYCFDEAIFFTIRHAISHTRPTGSSSLRSELLLKRQAYLDTYAAKPVEHIMSRQSFVQYQAILKKNDLRIDLKAQLKKYPRVKIFVIDKLHNPFSTYISPHMVIQPLFFPSRTDRLLLLQGKEITATYQDYFTKYQQDAKPINSYGTV
jgi:hypothetical protein